MALGLSPWPGVVEISARPRGSLGIRWMLAWPAPAKGWGAKEDWEEVPDCPEPCRGPLAPLPLELYGSGLTPELGAWVGL